MIRARPPPGARPAGFPICIRIVLVLGVLATSMVVVFWDVGAWELKGMHAAGRGGVDNMGETDGPCFLKKKINTQLSSVSSHAYVHT